MRELATHTSGVSAGIEHRRVVSVAQPEARLTQSVEPLANGIDPAGIPCGDIDAGSPDYVELQRSRIFDSTLLIEKKRFGTQFSRQLDRLHFTAFELLGLHDPVKVGVPSGLHRHPAVQPA